jgi:outer membrane receptor for ferrienterochelin and colicins
MSAMPSRTAATEPLRRLSPWLVSCLLSCLLAGGAPARPAFAGTACALQDAGAGFQEGKLDEARQAVESCLRSSPSRQEKARANEILAKIHLAEDDLPQARHAIEEVLRSQPDYAPDRVTEAPRFVRLVEQVRRDAGTVQVSSVSKTPESLREAPATIVVLTANEIERRGYLDLEAVLHDLPGFDISRTNGLTYANVYQRGYRSDLTTRTLLMIDGVEENDLWGQIAYLSRQYPLTDVERVEVIYGPASTMYGPNAFAGVINVITKEPEAQIAPGKKLGLHADVTSGAWNTSSLDATLAGQTGDGVSWSLTGRRFRSDEFDLSRYPDWDYDLGNVDYTAALSLQGAASVQTFRNALNAKGLSDCTGKPGCPYAVSADGVRPTAAGIAAARALDTAALHKTPDGRSAQFSDPTDDWAVHGKLRLANLAVGFQIWRQEEGQTPWYTERSALGGSQGMMWTPQQSWFYLKYSHTFGDGLSLSLFSRYKLHELVQPSVSNNLSSYADKKLGLADLAAGTAAAWKTANFYLTNNQLANELSLAYAPSERLSLVSGLEIRNSSIQGDYVTSVTGDPAQVGNARTTPGGNPTVPGGNRLSVLELGLYAQASYWLRTDLKAVAGGRLDHGSSDGVAGGYGSVFNPRLALIYTPGPLTFKAIYSQAFQDASDFQRFSTNPGVRDLSNPALTPEIVKNYELSAAWQPSQRFSLDAAAYQATYTGIAQLRQVAYGQATTTQFQSLGTQQIRGLQADASYTQGRWTLFGNYTFTAPYETDPKDSLGQPQLDGRGLPISRLRIADIASHRANLGVDTALSGGLRADLRLQFVGPRPTGAGTTNPTNPVARLGSALVANAALTYQTRLPGAKVQLLVDNLFDKRYSDPGVRTADGSVYAATIPQPGRAVYLRLSVSR